MIYRTVIICLVLCIMLFVVGCTSKANAPSQVYHEDFEGTTQNTQESVLSAMEDIYARNGYPYFNPDIPQYFDTFVSFLMIAQDEAGMAFDLEVIRPIDSGYCVPVKTPLDAWGNQMTVYVSMPDTEAWKYEISIVSSGPDGEQQLDGDYSQSAVDKCDDIFARHDGVGVVSSN